MIIDCESTVWLAIYIACPSCGWVITQTFAPPCSRWFAAASVLAGKAHEQSHAFEYHRVAATRRCAHSKLGLRFRSEHKRNGPFCNSSRSLQLAGTINCARVVRVQEKQQAAAAAQNDNSATSKAATGGAHHRTVAQLMYCFYPLQRANYTVRLHALLQQQNSLCTLASYSRTSAM
jgi:hypothetical protein